MEFKVIFKASNGYAIDIESMDTGLNGVELIRRETEANLKLDRISYYRSAICTNPEITISEETARQSKLFAKQNSVSVTVPMNSLNKFVDGIVRTSCDDTNGEIHEAWISREVYKARLISEWEDAGFPLNWVIETESEEYFN